MTWQVVIGLETHVQLRTQSKIFSTAPTLFGAAPNAQAAALDLALPGTLPVLNRQAVAHAIAFGVAIGAEINPSSVFARKHYFYPDLPKGYQISQFDQPIVIGGQVDIEYEGVNGTVRDTVQMTRAHLEEDAGKSLHEDFVGMSGIDLNRAGTPLLEIVTEPVMHSPRAAVAYARTLHRLVMWLGICDGNMQEGSFRCDANVSIRRIGAPLGTRTELKNLNSFRFLEQAMEIEIARHIEVLESGGHIVQETRLFDPDRHETRAMRSKEDAHDYRYFPEPDLLPVRISRADIDAVRATMPTLPTEQESIFVKDYQLSAYDARQLVQTRALSQYFLSAVGHLPATVKNDPLNIASLNIASFAKNIANWILGEISAALNRDSERDNVGFEACPITATQLARLVMAIEQGLISNKAGKEILQSLWSTPRSDDDAVAALIDSMGLSQVNDSAALDAWVAQAITECPDFVAQYHAGKDKAFNALVGRVMKQSQGKANPQQVNQILREQLEKHS